MPRKAGSGKRQTTEYYRLRDRQKKGLQRLLKEGAITKEEFELMMLPTEATARKLGIDTAAAEQNSGAISKAISQLRQANKSASQQERLKAKNNLLRESIKQQVSVAQPRFQAAAKALPKMTETPTKPFVLQEPEELEKTVSKFSDAITITRLQQLHPIFDIGVDAQEVLYPNLRRDIKTALERMGVANISEEDKQNIMNFVNSASIRELIRAFANKTSYVGQIYSMGGVDMVYKHRQHLFSNFGYGSLNGKDILQAITRVYGRVIDGKMYSYTEIADAYSKYKRYPLEDVRKAEESETGFEDIPQWAAKVVLSPRTYGLGVDWEE